MSKNIQIKSVSFDEFKEISAPYLKNIKQEDILVHHKAENIDKKINTQINSEKSLIDFIDSINPNDIAVVYNDQPKPKTPRPR